MQLPGYNPPTTCAIDRTPSLQPSDGIVIGYEFKLQSGC